MTTRIPQDPYRIEEVANVAAGLAALDRKQTMLMAMLLLQALAALRGLMTMTGDEDHAESEARWDAATKVLGKFDFGSTGREAPDARTH